MKPLTTRIFLAALVILLIITAGSYTNDDALSTKLSRAERFLKKGDTRQAGIVIDKVIDGDVLHYNALAYAFYADIEKTDNPMLLQVIIDRAKRLAGGKKLTKEEWALFHCGNAVLYEKLKQFDQAEAELQKALALAPESPSLLNRMGWFYADNGIKLEQALKLTRRAVELAPDQAVIIDSLGWAYYKLGRYSEAVTTLRRAVELNPDQAELRYHLGAAYVKQGRQLQARIELSKALLLKPSYSEPRELLRSNCKKY